MKNTTINFTSRYQTADIISITITTTCCLFQMTVQMIIILLGFGSATSKCPPTHLVPSRIPPIT